MARCDCIGEYMAWKRQRLAIQGSAKLRPLHVLGGVGTFCCGVLYELATTAKKRGGDCGAGGLHLRVLGGRWG